MKHGTACWNSWKCLKLDNKGENVIYFRNFLMNNSDTDNPKFIFYMHDVETKWCEFLRCQYWMRAMHRVHVFVNIILISYWRSRPIKALISRPIWRHTGSANVKCNGKFYSRTYHSGEVSWFMMARYGDFIPKGTSIQQRKRLILLHNV